MGSCGAGAWWALGAGNPAERSGGSKVYGAGAWQAGCSFSKLWRGEDFHELEFQNAEVSAQVNLCFTSAKCVCRISARSLIHGAHTVCSCVPVAILDPLFSEFFV
jgi:hypothetical protein